MANAKKKDEQILVRMTEAKTEGHYVPLNMLKYRPELFRHREEEELSEGKLSGLYNSLIVHGQEEPIEYAMLDGEMVVIKGHRRTACYKLMIANQVEGIRPDHPILAKEVKDFDKCMIDLVSRSITDNVNRESVTELARVKAALKLRELGARDERVRVAVGVSETTLARYYRLGDNRWMLDHVIEGDLRLSDAYALLEAAVNNNKVDSLRKDLAGRFAEIREKIEALEAKRLDEKNESLKKSERLVQNHIESHEMETWVAAVKQGRGIGTDARWVYKAVVDEPQKGFYRLKLPAVSIDLVGDELDRVQTVKERLEKILRDLKTHLKRLEADREIRRAAAEDASVARAEAAPQATPPPTEAPPPAKPRPAEDRRPHRQLADPLAGVEIPGGPDGAATPPAGPKGGKA